MKHYDFTNDPEKKGDDAVSIGRVKKRKLDLVPRLICLLIALFIWSYMVNLNDTGATDTMTLKVEIVGVEELKNNSNMIIYGLNRDSITVNVKGSQRDLRSYGISDYKAIVDVSRLDEVGMHNLPVSIQTPSGSSITVTGAEPSGVTLFSDINAKKSVRLDVVQGDMITLSSYTYDIIKDVDYIEITGPGAMLDSIDSARYTVSGEFYSSKTFSGYAPEFCDKNGDIITFEKDLIGYSTVGATIRVNVRTSKQIPVKVNLHGVGSNLTAHPDVSYLTIFGDPTALAQISEYTVNISAATPETEHIVRITSASFPDGVKLSNNLVTITITFSDNAG